MHPPRPAIEVERRTPKPRQRKRAVKEPAVEKRPNRNSTNQPVLAWLTRLAFCSLFWSAATQGENLKTESRTPFLHHIPVRDAEGQVIALPAPFDEQGKPQEARANPVSTAQTCGRCHEYEAIGNGWHFNAAKGNAKPGRPGEPWILADPATRTQIPISYRGWPGTVKPADLGMNDFDFLMEFARHLPG